MCIRDRTKTGQVPPRPPVNTIVGVVNEAPSNPSDDNSFCTNRVCIDCYEAVARDLQREIRLYNKTNLAYGNDAMALLRAFRLGEEVGRIKDVGMTTVNDLSRQNCICQCSYGPFPSEVSQESDACSNTAGLDKSFWRAKNDRGVSNPNAWKAGMQVALRIAAAHCDGCGVPHTTSVDWPSTELFKAEAKRLKFARPADL